jgi:hypothetical protein
MAVLMVGSPTTYIRDGSHKAMLGKIIKSASSSMSAMMNGSTLEKMVEFPSDDLQFDRNLPCHRCSIQDKRAIAKSESRRPNLEETCHLRIQIEDTGS